jgi:ASC-1-like (ASCH) protein
MGERFGDIDIEEIKERVEALCSEMKLPLRVVYVSADFQEEVYQVEVELFKEYESLEDMLREEISIEEGLKEFYGDSISVNIVSVEEEL